MSTRSLAALALGSIILACSGCQTDATQADGPTDPATVTVTQPASPAPEPQTSESEVPAEDEVAASTSAAATTAEANWDSAASSAGDVVTICGPLVSVRDSSGYTFFNVGADYPDPARFTFLLPAFALEGTDDEPTGMTICGTGEVELYNGLPQIKLNSVNELSFQ